MNTKKVYLAGPIAHQTFDGADEWRQEATSMFMDMAGLFGIEVFSPLREKRRFFSPNQVLTSQGYDVHPLTTSRGIMTRDHNDCKTADLIFVNLTGAKHVSIGTVMEMAWAYAYRVPCVVVMEASGNPHDNHAMLQQTIDYRFTDLEEAVDCAVSVLRG